MFHTLTCWTHILQRTLCNSTCFTFEGNHFIWKTQLVLVKGMCEILLKFLIKNQVKCYQIDLNNDDWNKNLNLRYSRLNWQWNNHMYINNINYHAVFGLILLIEIVIYRSVFEVYWVTTCIMRKWNMDLKIR